MAELTPEIVDQMAEACKGGAEEAAAALSRALDAKVTLSVGQPGFLDQKELPKDLAGPGLVAVLTVGSTALLLVLPEATGLVPPWCAKPDATGGAKLATLAQELAAILLPEQSDPQQPTCVWVPDLAASVRRGGIAESAAVVPLQLRTEGGQGTARLLWPAAEPGKIAEPAQESPQTAAAAEPASQTAGEPSPPEAEPPAPPQKALPPYTRSLLQIKLPVVVTLAEKRQPMGRIVELGPGSIIQFDKSCEEMLQLDVGTRPVASGEAVKVGDKFGLRIISIIPPGERFLTVRPKP